MFRSKRNHVFELLGPAQNYSSGIFREELLREFLRSVLPRALSVDSGFIYGFEKMQNSAQLDLIVWDSVRHSAVYEAGNFVIVAPESVVAVISVKTGMTAGDVNSAFDNLLSIAPLDLAYRAADPDSADHGSLRPISKFVVCYDTVKDVGELVAALAAHSCDILSADPKLSHPIVTAARNIDPYKQFDRHWWPVERVLPRMIVSLEENGVSCQRGWGPPDKSTLPEDTPHQMKRVPYLYPQFNSITSPIEKLVYHLLEESYIALNTEGHSLVAAWGDFDPQYGFRMGDAAELNVQAGRPLMDPARVSFEPKDDL